MRTNDDDLIEGDERFTVTIPPDSRNPPRYTVGSPSSFSGTLRDNDFAVATIALTGDAAREEGLGHRYTITLTPDQGKTLANPVNVRYRISGAGGAQADADDFVGGTTGSVSVGTSGTETFTITTTDDNVGELDEGFTVTLRTAANRAPYKLSTDTTELSAPGTILNDDPPVAGIAASGATEVAEGGGLAYTVTFTPPPTADVVVSYTLSGTRVTASDFSGGLTGMVTVGTSGTGTFTLNSAMDVTAEATETVTVTLTDGDGYNLGTPVSATGTITDNDVPTFSLPPTVSVAEDGGSATVTVTADIRRDAAYTITYAIAPGTGTGAAMVTVDYTLPDPLTVTFPAGAAGATQTFSIPIVDNSTVQGDRSFTVSLASAMRGGNTEMATVAPGTTTVTIIDDEVPSVLIGGVANGSVQGQTFTVNFTLNQTPVADSFNADDIIVTNLNKGTLVGAGTDTAYSMVMTAAADGPASVAVRVAAYTSGTVASVAAAPVTFTVDRTSPTIASISSTTADGTYAVGAPVGGILIDIAFNDASVLTQTNTNGFTLTLSNGATAGFGSLLPGGAVRFIYTVATGDAADPDLDVTAVNLNGGSVVDAANNMLDLTALPGGTNSLAGSSAIVIGDTIAPLVMGLSAPPGAYPLGAMIGITLTLNEAVMVTGTPQLSLNNGAMVVYSGDGTTASATQTFTYTVAAGADTTGLNVNSISGGTITDTSGNPATDLSIPTGQNLADGSAITIDTMPPTVILALASGFTAPTIGDFDVTVTFSDDVGTTFAAGDLTVVGGAVQGAPTGTGMVRTVTVRPGAGQNAAITIDMAAVAVTDLAGNGNTVAPQLSVVATLPTVSVAAAATSVTEGVTAPFTISLDAPYPYAVTVPFTVTGAGGATPSSATGATDPVDFTVPATLSVSFAVNDAADKTVSVTTSDDTVRDGPGEGVILTLGTPTNAQAASGAAATVGLNDNDVPGLTITPTSLTVTEGTAGQTYTVAPNVGAVNGTVVVTVTAPAATLVSTTASPTASQTVTLTFAAGSVAAQTVTVTTPDDDDGRAVPMGTIAHTTSTSGDSEYAALTASDKLPPVTVTFIDDDTPALVFPSAVAVTEGTAQTFTVALATAPLGNVAVAVAMTGDVSVATPTPASLTFLTTRDVTGGWNLPQTVTLAAADDSIQRAASATISLTASSSTDMDYAGLPAGSVTLAVTDNDIPGVTVDTGAQAALTVNEGDATGVSYTVVLDSQPAGNVMVTLTAGGSALQVAGAQTTVLTFTTAADGTTGSWNFPQPVAVTALSDDNTDNESLTITHSLASPTDPKYAALTVGPVMVTVLDSQLLQVNAGAVANQDGTMATLPTTQVKVQLLPVGLPADTPMATVALPNGHGVTGVATTTVLRSAGGPDDGRPGEVAAGDPGPYVVQFTPVGTLVGMATVCLPLGPDQNARRTDMYRAADDPGAAWTGPLTVAASADPGLFCAQTPGFSVFRLFARRGLASGDRGNIAGQWLGRFGRMVAAGTVDTIADRVRRFRDGTKGPRQNMAIGGRSFTLPGANDAAVAGSLGTGNGDRGYGAGGVYQPGAVQSNGLPAAFFSAGSVGHQPGSPSGVVAGMGGGNSLSGLAGGAGFPASAGFEGQRAATGPGGLPRVSDLLAGSSFDITLAAADGAAGGVGGGGGGAGGTLAVWGTVNTGSFDATPGNGFNLTGNLLAGHLGLDYATNRLLIGVDLARSNGDGNFSWTDPNAGGDPIGGSIKTTLTSAHPYLAYRTGNRASAWVSMGLGQGTMTFTENQADGTTVQVKTNTNMVMGAAGGLVEGWRQNRFSMDLQAEMFVLKIGSDGQFDGNDATPDMASTDVNVSQARVGLAGRGEWAVGNGGRFVPSAEVQVRADGGQLETGVGIEAGGDLRLDLPQQGLTISGGGRYLMAHSVSAYKEWRADMTVRFDPSVVGQGMFFELSPRYGSGLSAAGDVWTQRPDELMRNTDLGASRDRLAGSLALNIGHGASDSARGWRRIEPWFGYEGPFAMDGRTLTLGGRYRSFERLELELTGQRRTDGYRGARHEVNLRAMLRL